MKDETSLIQFNSDMSNIVSTKVTAFANDYRICVCKTAESILDLAKIVGRAKIELTDSEFQAFRNEIKADKSKDSYIKKLLCIASKFERFKDIVECLPSSYTTLYDLAKISDAEFDAVKETLSPATTANNICEILLPYRTAKNLKLAKPSIPMKMSSKIEIDASSVSQNAFDNILVEIEQICRNYSLPSPLVVS